jgi:hypothetical protein
LIFFLIFLTLNNLIIDDDIVAAVNSKPEDIKKPKIREAYMEKEEEKAQI